MKHAATLFGAVVMVASLGGAASARRAAPPAPAGLVQVAPERFAIEPSVLIEVAVDGLAGRIAVTQTPTGYRLDTVPANSTLSQLGLRAGDVVASLNGVALTSRAALRKAHAASRTAGTLEVQATRGGRALVLRYRVVDDVRTLARTLAPLAPHEAELVALIKPGIKVIGATHVEIDEAVLRALAAHRALPSDASGRLGDPVIVYRAGSLLEALGLAVFDRIVSVDGSAIDSDRDLGRALGQLATRARFAIELERNGAPLSITYTAVTGSFDATALDASLPAGYDPNAQANADALAAAIDKGVRKLSDTHYQLQRSVLDQLLANPMAAARGARIVPSIKDGKANGFKLYAIRPSSIYAKVGFANGDTVHSVNGIAFDSPDKALEVYSKVSGATSVRVEITRRGKPVKLRIDVK